jgi:hypothetical protein
MIDFDTHHILRENLFWAAAAAEFAEVTSYDDARVVGEACDKFFARKGIRYDTHHRWSNRAGARLSNLIIEAGWSADSIAQHFGCSTEAIQRIYAGERNSRRIDEICDLINADSITVYTGRGQDWKTGGPTAP